MYSASLYRCHARIEPSREKRSHQCTVCIFRGFEIHGQLSDGLEPTPVEYFAAEL